MDEVAKVNWERWNAEIGTYKTTPIEQLNASIMKPTKVYVLHGIDVLKGKPGTQDKYDVIGHVNMLGITEADLAPAKKRAKALKTCPHCGKALR